MLAQDAAVDGCQGVQPREAESEDGEVSLEPGVDGEAAGRRVHARHVLGVVDLFEAELLPVKPMAVVQMLSDQRVWLHREVLIHLFGE